MFMIIYTLQVQYVRMSACIFKIKKHNWKQVIWECFCCVFGGEHTHTHSDVTDWLPSFKTELQQKNI